MGVPFSPAIAPISLCIWTINIQSMTKSHTTELQHRLHDGRPHILCAQETWLKDKSAPLLDNYEVVAKMDRTTGRKAGYGGVLIYRRNDFDFAYETLRAEHSELVFATLHTPIGPILLANMYRPPDAGDATLAELEHLLTLHMQNHIGTIVVGDFNAHHHNWLKHSSTDTKPNPAGHRLYDITTQNELKQMVNFPTHQKGNLLDLVFTD